MDSSELWLRGAEELLRARDGEDVYKDGVLTLDACVCSLGTKEVGVAGDFARSAAAGVEEDADGGDDTGDPAAIPCTRIKRTARRS